MEIEVGDFVRTKNNGIKRIDTIFENKTVNKYGYETGSDWDGKWYSHIKKTEIVKHSKNVIDLIEVGDYVNGKYVEEINQYEAGKFIITLLAIIHENDIKTIVTKEQFKSMEYKV